jgi:branched-chain amino acid transport system ATP-binding protein
LADLILRDVTVRYGKLVAVDKVSMSVSGTTCVGILGPNGAGKTSILRAISGNVPYEGSVMFDGSPVVGRPEEIVRRGIAHVLEGRHIFSRLSVRENLELARFGCTDDRFADRLAWVLDFFPMLRDKLAQPGTALSGGQQQILAIARALLTGPKVLLLDEPSLGLAPIVIDQLATALPEIMRSWDLTVVLAEQFIQFASAVATEVYIFRLGKVAYSGSTADPGFATKVLEHYLETTVTDAANEE